VAQEVLWNEVLWNRSRISILALRLSRKNSHLDSRNAKTVGWTWALQGILHGLQPLSKL